MREAMELKSATRRRPSPASEAWALMHELFHASRRRFLAIASEFELSPPQVRALGVLARPAQRPRRPVEAIDVVTEPGGVQHARVAAHLGRSIRTGAIGARGTVGAQTDVSRDPVEVVNDLSV